MTYWESTGRTARKIIIDGAMMPLAEVKARLPATPTSRNVMFHLVNVATGECLPKLKRSSELAQPPSPGLACAALAEVGAKFPEAAAYSKDALRVSSLPGDPSYADLLRGPG